ncbi:unnamed protein product [Paramecium sonneborni]|uniref:Uncharacterized protein n=1 Tax=Paramecium sonneborni TaxID=65129 RepID=A0A8S1RUN1_9CILI|nr:unnamed protein product [Paramecium sonneborni]
MICKLIYLQLYLEIELLPFNDEQRKKYFQFNHQRIIKKFIFKYFIRSCESYQNIIKDFEDIWKNYEIQFLELINQQEQSQKTYILNEDLINEKLKIIIKNNLIKKITDDQYQKLVQELSNLKCSICYLQMIQNHNIECITQTSLQLQILLLILPKLIKYKSTYGFQEQIRKQNFKRIKQQQQILNSNYSGIGSEISSSTQEFDKIIDKLEVQNFLKEYSYFKKISSNYRGILMEGKIYEIQNNNQNIVFDALKANKITIYKILEIFVLIIRKRGIKQIFFQLYLYL